MSGLKYHQQHSQRCQELRGPTEVIEENIDETTQPGPDLLDYCSSEQLEEHGYRPLREETISVLGQSGASQEGNDEQSLNNPATRRIEDLSAQELEEMRGLLGDLWFGLEILFTTDGYPYSWLDSGMKRCVCQWLGREEKDRTDRPPRVVKKHELGRTSKARDRHSASSVLPSEELLPSSDPAARQGSNWDMQRLQNIEKTLTQFKAKCKSFLQDTSTPLSKAVEMQHKILSEEGLTQVLLKLDEVETEGNDTARELRKKLVRETQKILRELDEALRSRPRVQDRDFSINVSDQGSVSPSTRPSKAKVHNDSRPVPRDEPRSGKYD